MTDVNGTLTIIPPPPGYVVNFENPQRHFVVETYTIAAVENLFALAFLVQRLYTKIHLMKQFQIEDAVVIIAWIFSSATQVALLYGWHKGVIGVHAWEISLDDYGTFSRAIMAAPLLYAICTAAAKTALCLFYRRLNPNKPFQAAVWASMFISIGAYTGIFFALLFACRPISASWNPKLLPTAICLNRGAIYIATAVIGVVTDLLVILLPIPTIWGLQMHMKQKLGLLGIFSVGSITMVTSIIRLVILLPALTTADQTWVIGEGSMWIFVETNLMIICCCLPTLRRFFKHVAPRLVGESRTGPSNPSRVIRTFGSTGPKKPFNSLKSALDDVEPNGDIMLDQMHDSRNASRRNPKVRITNVKGDDDSEEAILFERTVQVTYSSPEDAGEYGQAHVGKIWAEQPHNQDA